MIRLAMIKKVFLRRPEDEALIVAAVVREEIEQWKAKGCT
jgi:hypothetical protein